VKANPVYQRSLWKGEGGTTSEIWKEDSSQGDKTEGPARRKTENKARGEDGAWRQSVEGGVLLQKSPSQGRKKKAGEKGDLGLSLPRNLHPKAKEPRLPGCRKPGQKRRAARRSRHNVAKKSPRDETTKGRGSSGKTRLRHRQELLHQGGRTTKRSTS